MLIAFCIFVTFFFGPKLFFGQQFFDQSCDPVTILDEEVSCLLWADDLLIISRSAVGLQNAINKTKSFYDYLGLEVNQKKSKVMILNGRGLKLDKAPEHQFFIGSDSINVVDTYQYLGISLKSSGSIQYSISELNDKASRAWFAISNTLYKYKRLPVSRAFQLFDSLIRPIALYSCEFWLPNILTKKNFSSKDALLRFWESLNFEVLNQKICRLLLSVHKRCSRLAALGELGRYPSFIFALKNCLKYEWSLQNCNNDSLISKAIQEMANKPYLDTWLSRVQKIKTLLGLPRLHGCKESVSHQQNKKLHSLFDLA